MLKSKRDFQSSKKLITAQDCLPLLFLDTQNNNPLMNIILGSTSKYRRELLDRLNFSYEVHSPKVDEEKIKDPTMNGRQLASFLATKKAESLIQGSDIIIGADQVVIFNNTILGKPKTATRAIEQLSSMQGQIHEIVTSFCVVNSSKKIVHTDVTKMHMRQLTLKQIENYVKYDQPFDCAGSYKIERLGISLFEKIETEDFTAIQGLPLIALIRSLKEFEVEIP